MAPPLSIPAGRWYLIVPAASLAMLAFAANSLLARAAMLTTPIDAASFTAIRIVSGALVLVAILVLQGGRAFGWNRDWPSALLLFIYAAAFSFAYRDIGTGAGALILFASAQLLMIGYGLYRGERASVPGLVLALAGFILFLAPSASSPAPWPAALMALAGLAWGAFSLRGKTRGAPIASTAASFVLAVPLAAGLVLWQREYLVWDASGALLAAVSGGLTSGVGYAIWYWVRVRMTAIGASAVQLSVPVLSAVLGWLALGEAIALRSAIPAAMTLAGVACVILTARPGRNRSAPTTHKP